MDRKVFVLAPNENWIIDRFVSEWNEHNNYMSTLSPDDADVIWLLADFCWQNISRDLLRTKKVLTTIHHIVPEKFDQRAYAEFMARDDLTTAYHVPNEITLEFVRKLTNKPVHVIPYWANQFIWRPIEDKNLLRKKHNLSLDKQIIGSFQRDTEGAGISKGVFLPKLEKGPDMFCDYVIWRHRRDKNVHVLLAGWRRQYIIERLTLERIPHSYIELPKQSMVNELYQCLDLYVISSRHEGGPQALLECGLLNIPVISTPVGMAKRVLSPKAINTNLQHAIPDIPMVSDLMLPDGYKPYRDLIQSI